MLREVIRLDVKSKPYDLEVNVIKAVLCGWKLKPENQRLIKGCFYSVLYLINQFLLFRSLTISNFWYPCTGLKETALRSLAIKTKVIVPFARTNTVSHPLTPYATHNSRKQHTNKDSDTQEDNESCLFPQMHTCSKWTCLSFEQSWRLIILYSSSKTDLIRVARTFNSAFDLLFLQE